MNRRRFIQFAGAAATSCATHLSQRAIAVEQSPPYIHADLLRGRNTNRSTVVAQRGMVCASQPLASLAGIDMLRAGGNCIDAAIATNAMLGLTEPASNGIGGDLFAIVWIEAERRLFGINASGRAPYDWNLAKANALGLQAIPRVSPLSWSVPGCVSGWGELSARFGRLGLKKCMEPAIDYARHGFPLTPIIAGHFAFDPQTFPTLARVYHPDGRVPRYGEVFKNPALARSYMAIAEGGVEAFYRGEIAERIVAKSREMGGHMSARDLADHSASWVEPVSTSYRGYDVWEIPPNGQGIAVLQMLNMLESFDIASMTPNSAEHLHLLVEAKKLAFEDRAVYYADPDFAEVPIGWLISKDYSRERTKLIDPRRASQAARPGDPPLDSDTVYLTAADDDGNMISLIQSIYNGFGSGICPDDVGFAIQNRGQAFSLDPQHRNRLEPHKRPFHTIIPAFVTRDNVPVLSFGVMGGDFQPQGHVQALMNLIDFKFSPQQAAEQPRLSHASLSEPWGATIAGGGRITLEKGFDPVTIQGLRELGHDVVVGEEAHGGYQAIWRENEPLRYFGGSDPRKDGAAIGY